MANTPISVNKNSRSASRPHVGTDPVSVRLTSVLRTEAILLVEMSERLRIYPGLRPMGADSKSPLGVCPYMRAGPELAQMSDSKPSL
uniref:hypothetical protein n=1 Tax=Prevotella micans TaxID=189723 RepID=UPI001EE2775C